MHLTRRKLFAAGAALLSLAAGVVWLALGDRSLHAQPALTQSLPAAKKDWEKFTYQDATKCTQCHSVPNPANRPSWDLCTFAEWPIWKTQDKHAQAYAVLVGERGQKIGELLFPKMDREKAHAEILKSDTGCIGCHAMSTLPGEMGKGVDPRDGVSCGGCHGPSSGWLGDHADRTKWRDVLTAEEKYKRGMRDLRDPVVRAELCMSCHVGNAEEGKVVSHAMMAAGHPPLPPIEVATFSKNEPPHWRNPKDIPYLKTAKPDQLKLMYGNRTTENLDFYQTELALAGSIVAVRETLKLARDRANFEGDPKLYFPELAIPIEGGANTPKDRWSEIAIAHSDCFACHHDLKYPGFRQARGFSYHVPGVENEKRVIPGRPMVRTWPMAGLTAGATHSGSGKLASLKPLLEALTDATNARPFGAPAALRTSADGMIKWCNDLLEELKNKPIDRKKAVDLANALIKLYDEKSAYKPDYETARQISSILLVVLEDLGVQDKALKELRDYLNTEPYFNREKRVGVVVDAVQSIMKANDNKAKDQFLAFTKNIDKSKTDELFGNNFLAQMFLTVGNDEFTKAITTRGTKDKPGIADLLQQFSDDEQKKVLQAVADYNPKKLFELLDKVAKLVPQK